MTVHLRDFIKTVESFDKLNDEFLGSFVGLLEPVALQDGDLLFRQGDTGHELYIVIEGTVRVSITQEDGSEVGYCCAQKEIQAWQETRVQQLKP